MKSYCKQRRIVISNNYAFFVSLNKHEIIYNEKYLLHRIYHKQKELQEVHLLNHVEKKGMTRDKSIEAVFY